MRKKLDTILVLLISFAFLFGCSGQNNPSPTLTAPADNPAATPLPTEAPGESDSSAITKESIARLEGIFAGGTKIWYEYAEDYDAPDKELTQKSFDLDEDKFKLYEHCFNCTWERADYSDADDTGAAVFIGDDSHHCFRFYLGSDIVAYINGEETEYYSVFRVEGDFSPYYPTAPLSKIIMQDFSGYELSAFRNISFKDSNFDNKEEVAYAYMEQYKAYLKALTPENWYSITDYQIHDLKMQEEEDDKFVFCVRAAIKPTILDNSPWFAGNGGLGKDEWDGYIVNKTTQFRLDLVDGYWICVKYGGGIQLKDPIESPSPGEPDSSTDDVTVIEQDGISIGFPREYYDLLLINPKENIYQEDGTLIAVFYKPTYEKSGLGYLFSIVRYNQAQYERYLAKGDFSGRFFFARDDTYFYGYFRPTDIQHFDKSDMDIFNNLKENLGEFVRQDIITRNNLSPYSDDEFWSKTYTYDGDHVYLTYYPYYAYQDTAAQQNLSWQDVAYTLVLSQPVRQGEAGIWCVERMYDDPKYGYLYIHFPNAEGLSAAEYYAKLQAECDSGLHPELLAPVQVALKFVKEVHGHSAATVDSFAVADGLPEGNYRP